VGGVQDAYSGISGIGNMEGVSEAWGVTKNTIIQALQNSFAGTVQTLSPLNTGALQGVIQNTVVNPYTEVLFNGVQNRTFSFTFKMIPRNLSEQNTLKEIIYQLKFHRAPELKFTEQSNYWLFPSEFDIQFFNKVDENPWLFKISTCALTEFSVNYSPEGSFASHAEGAPFAVEMTMSFMELEQLTKSRVEEGF
jgi:hypothetical protein